MADKKIVVDIKNDNGKVVGKKDKYVNSKPLGVMYSKLIDIAATSYAESSSTYGVDNKDEIFSLAYIHYKYPKNTAYGEGTAQYTNLVNAEPSKRNGRFYQTSIAAVINAILNGLDQSNDSTHWDGTDILTGRRAYGWDALKHPKQKPEGKYKGISDPFNLAATYYNTIKNYFDERLSRPNLNKDVRADLQAKRDHLQPLHLYMPEYDENDKLKFIPLYEIRATYALSIFYKKLR